MRLFKFRRDPTDPVDRVERFWHGRRLRLVAGIIVAENFASVRGVVVRAQGEGKYLGLQQLASAEIPVRRELALACQRLCQIGNGSTNEFVALTNDLASIQAELVNQLRGSCDAAAESLLAVCVADPGLWSQDFDGRKLYSSFCNPELLSSLSGVSVIDALPAKDLVAGGHGWPLTPLACWLLLADRTNPVATYSRLLVMIDRGIEFFFLPVSDGLDDEYPEIRHSRFVGTNWLTELESGPQKSSGKADNGRKSHGRIVESLENEWSSIVERLGRAPNVASLEAELAARTVAIAESAQFSANDISATARHWSREQLEKLVERCVGQAGEPLQIFLAGEETPTSGIVEVLRRRFPEAVIESVMQLGFDPDYLIAVLVAALGSMHIDQMPSNLPWLTGVETPRILGRLTPGPPNQWRMLLREMADYHPPAMRLRDAV